MAVIRWDPFRDFMTLQNEVSRLFERSYGTAAEGGAKRTGVTPVWTPAADIYEKDGNLVVEVDLPGLDADDVSVTVEEGNLVIKGERSFSSEISDEDAYRIERRYGLFERVLTLPDDVDADRIAAQVEHGVLTVTLPRKPEIKPKQIKVDVAAAGQKAVDTKASKK
jgi:HSP20 family protein